MSSIKVGGTRLELQHPIAMAIINVTPDSFYPESRVSGEEEIRRRVSETLEQGAAIIDIGGCSTRPGADEIVPEEELRRLELGVGTVRRYFPEAIVSLDTFRGSVARTIVERYGPCILNDVRGGEDAGMARLAAEYDLPLIVMHSEPLEGDSAGSVVSFFRRRLGSLRSQGVQQLIIDPGFGFAKSLEQNYELLAGLGRLKEFGLPLLVGISRKSMIYGLLGITPEAALPATSALHMEALRLGASILRIHDTCEAVQVIRLHEAIGRKRRG